MRSEIMSDSEVNKIIADFMWSDCDSWDYGFIDGDVVVNYDIGLKLKINYTKSLDALVPVWEKLSFWSLYLYGDKSATIQAPVNKSNFDSIEESTDKMKSIQQAAAHATAKAILELKGE